MTRWDELARAVLKHWDESAYTDHYLEAIVVGLTLTPADLAAFRLCDVTDQEALTRLLDDRRARHVVKSIVLTAKYVPEQLFIPMLRAGVRTIDPSYNRQFISPCVLTQGRRRTMTELLLLANQGSNDDKVGAVKAWYWGSASASSTHWYFRGEAPDPELPDDPVEDLDREFARWALKEFLENADVEVRRWVDRYLAKPSDLTPEECQRALTIAERHADPYIRRRIAAQLGTTSVSRC